MSTDGVHRVAAHFCIHIASHQHHHAIQQHLASLHSLQWLHGTLGTFSIEFQGYLEKKFRICNLWQKFETTLLIEKTNNILRLDEEFARPTLSCGGTIWLSFLSSFYCMKDFSDVWYHASVKEPSTKVPQSANTIMWRFIPPVIPLKNLHQVVLRSSVNTVKLYHAKSGCFGYRPAPQIIHAGQL